jgi:3',5'-cyclic AMP phosphodiesterase CpdA
VIDRRGGGILAAVRSFASRIGALVLGLGALAGAVELTSGPPPARAARAKATPRKAAAASAAVSPSERAAREAEGEAAGEGAREGAPEARLDSAPLRVAVISDLNGRYGSTTYQGSVHAAVDRLLEASPDLVLSTGDMVAGQRRGIDHEAMWEGFHAAVSDRLAEAGIPFAVTPGNHDASGYEVFAEERALFVRQWTRRRPEVRFVDDSHYPLRYSFTVGPAFFVSLDATTVGPLSDEQRRWLDRQLAAAPQPVKIVFGHVPLHPFAIGREREHLRDPELEALLLRHGVELFVSGHHHAYYPGRRGPLRLVSTACVGAGPRPLIGTDRRSPRSIVLFDVTADGVRDLDAWGGESYERRIERASLPPHVGAGAHRIDRDDLVPAPRQRLGVTLR